MDRIKGVKMDRFKFRVWDTDIKEYLVGEFLVGGFGDMIHNVVDYESFLNKGNYIIEQCTGLKDKNGNLIYEGDIVKGRYFNPHHPETPNPKIKGVMRFIQDRMTWIIEDGDEGYDFEDCMPTKEYFEIIDNIHETKGGNNE